MKLYNETKETIATYYYKIVANPKDYDSVSKEKMIDEIVSTYHNPTNIQDICTEKELDILNQINNNKYTYHKEDIIVLDNLVKKLLINSVDNHELTKEFKEYINAALSSVDLETVRKNDNINELAVSFIKVLGYTDKNNVSSFIRKHLKLSEEEIEHHIRTNKLFNYYIDTGYIDEDNILHYQDYTDYLIDLEDLKEVYGIDKITELKLEDYKTIFYNHVNINNESVAKMFNSFIDKPYFLELLFQIEIAVLLNFNHNSFFQDLVPILKNDFTIENLSLIDAAMWEMPSGVLNGLTKKKYE